MAPVTQKDAQSAAGRANLVRALRMPKRTRHRVLLFVMIGLAGVGSLVVAPHRLRVGIFAVELATIAIGAAISFAMSAGERLEPSGKVMDGMEAANIQGGTRNLM